MHLILRQSYFVDHVLNVVLKNFDGLTILTIYRELTATRVLVESDQRSTIRFSHNLELFFHNVDASCLDWVRIP